MFMRATLGFEQESMREGLSLRWGRQVYLYIDSNQLRTLFTKPNAPRTKFTEGLQKTPTPTSLQSTLRAPNTPYVRLRHN
jgi:hypothetical protein